MICQLMCSDGRRNWTVSAQWKVNQNQHVPGVYTEACVCAAFANALDETKGPFPREGIVIIITTQMTMSFAPLDPLLKRVRRIH